MCIRDSLNSLQWDGTERIRYALHHFLGADTDEYTYEALKLLSDKSRFEIMSYLSEKPAYAGELVTYSGLTAATISHRCV